MVEALKPEERVEAARKAIQPMASQLQRAGVDVNALVTQAAQQFANSTHKDAQIPRAAISAFYNMPGIADKMVRMRTQGLDADGVRFANQYVSERGTQGAQKVNDANTAVNFWRGLNAEERAQAREDMNSGAPARDIQAAITSARKAKPVMDAHATAQAAAAQQAAREPVKQAPGTIPRATERETVLQMQRAVNAERTYPRDINQFGASLMGAAAMTGTVGEMVVGGVIDAGTALASAASGGRVGRTHMFTHALDTADNSVKALFGELREKVTAANTAYDRFNSLHLRYASAYERHQKAVADNDIAAMGNTAREMNELMPLLHEAAADHRSKAAAATKASQAFNSVFVAGYASALAAGAGVGIAQGTATVAAATTEHAVAAGATHGTETAAAATTEHAVAAGATHGAEHAAHGGARAAVVHVAKDTVQHGAIGTVAAKPLGALAGTGAAHTPADAAHSQDPAKQDAHSMPDH